MTDRTSGFSVGYDQAMCDAFHPEMGWFWQVLGDVRDELYPQHPNGKDAIGDMNDKLVEEIIRRVGG